MDPRNQSRCCSAHRSRGWQVEALEPRALLACVFGDGAARAPNGTLTIDGTNASDNIAAAIQVTDPDPLITGDAVSNLVVTRGGSVVANCLLSDVSKLVINGGNGNDNISIDDAVLLDAALNGGNGKDVMDGGGGNDLLDGGNGKDALDGDAGNDLLLGGNGSDNLQGDAGDDSLKGGNGPDVLVDSDSTSNLDGGLAPDTINGVLEPLAIGNANGNGHGNHRDS